MRVGPPWRDQWLYKKKGEKSVSVSVSPSPPPTLLPSAGHMSTQQERCCLQAKPHQTPNLQHFDPGLPASRSRIGTHIPTITNRIHFPRPPWLKFGGTLLNKGDTSQKEGKKQWFLVTFQVLGAPISIFPSVLIFYKSGLRKSEKLSNWPKVTQLVSNRARILTRGCVMLKPELLAWAT